MPLNLVTDAWIPVIRHGSPTAIRPHEIAVEGVERLNWPRDDLNLACLELLIGLVYLADPPRDEGDWHDRYDAPQAERLRVALECFGPHVELTGNGPRFLQDLEPFETHVKRGAVSPPDMLFVDSAGANTVRNNRDLMVKRNRYASLPLPLAAMSLYTLQAFAPSGGAGNRASMRGGGPMVTLVRPLYADTYRLWRTVWCNVPEGQPLAAKDAAQALPWLRPTRTSEKGQIVTPDMSHDAEAFFGMPRRLRLVFENDTATGVVQRRYGTHYAGWVHPLSPYYCREAGGERVPVHPQPGKVSFRNWLGLAFGRADERRLVAQTVRRYHELADAPDAEVCVGGWAMSNMKPVDFGLHTYPTFRLDEPMEMRVGALVEVANFVSRRLYGLLKEAVALQGSAAGAVQESFYSATEPEFVNAVQCVADGRGQDVEEAWMKALRSTALAILDRYTLSALSSRSLSGIEAAVAARRTLLSVLAKQGGARELVCPTTAAREHAPMSNRKNVGAICAEWWRQTFGREDAAARMTRARLRRCTTSAESLMIEEVHDLNRRMRDAGFRPAADQLALIAIALAYVEDSGTQTLAKAFGRRNFREGPRALRPSRFHALVRTRDKAQLITPLRRAMTIVRRTPIGVTPLATDLFHWNEGVRNSWCFQYFDASDSDPERIHPGIDE